MGDLSRKSSLQPILQADDTTSLTSFPDPAESVASSRPQSPAPQDGPRLNGLLDRIGPSMFDEQVNDSTEPQVLSAASDETILNVIEHHGTINLIRRLSALLAERDALVTALTKLAEEYKVPSDRIAATSDRVKRSEQRRLSLAAAMLEENRPPQIVHATDSDGSESLPPVDPNATIRGITKLFGGGTHKRRSMVVVSPESDSSSRSTSRPPRQNRARPHSVDVQSVTSVESAGWTSTLWNAGGTIKNIGANKKQPDSRPPREPVEMSTRHDPDQLPPTLSHNIKDPQEAEWNKFIVRLMKSRESAGIEARSDELIGASHFGTEGTTGRHKMETLTRLLLNGIPMSLRHQIWMELSHTASIVQPDAYTHYLSLPTPPTAIADLDAILKDIPRTLTSKYDFYADKGHDRLKRVLLAFVARYPGLGYTQGLNMIAGYLLLAIPTESDAFWMLCALVDPPSLIPERPFFPADYFARDTHLAGPIADAIVLRGYIRDLLPKLEEALVRLDVAPPHTVPLAWFLTAYASVLPASAVLRVWDVWLCLPGQRGFLFNVALALVGMHVHELCACESQGEFFDYMNGKCRVGEEAGEVDGLIRAAWMWRRKMEGLEVRRALAMKELKSSPSTDALYAKDGDERVEE